MTNDFTDSVTIPAAQSLITGALAGLLSGGTAWMFHFPDAIPFAMTAGAGVALVAWLDYRAQWQHLFESLLQVTPSHTEQAEPFIEPARAAEPVKVFVEQDQGRHVTILDLPARAEQLTAFADGVLAGRSLSQAAWTGRGQPFSRSEYDSIRDELIRRGLARWKSEGEPAQGWELLAPGRAVLRHFASEAPTPQLPAHVVKVR